MKTIPIESFYENLPEQVNPAFRNNLGNILLPVPERTKIISDYVNKEGYLKYVQEINQVVQPELNYIKDKHKVYFLFNKPKNNVIRQSVLKNDTVIIETDGELTRDSLNELSNQLRESFRLRQGTTGFKSILENFSSRMIA